jgi:carbamate kinase
MRIVVALGGNALSKRGETLTAAGQRASICAAAQSLAELLEAGHEVVITHGNGPQVGYLALQAGAFPLDVLGAETDGMIGYVLQQELDNAYAPDAKYATLLTQIEVDPGDPAFQSPTKFIGPIYKEAEAAKLSAERGWTIGKDGAYFRRTVPSPRPKRILELDVINLLLEQKVIVICAGGGGIPVAQKPGCHHDRGRGGDRQRSRQRIFGTGTERRRVFDAHRCGRRVYRLGQTGSGAFARRNTA